MRARYALNFACASDQRRIYGRLISGARANEFALAAKLRRQKPPNANEPKLALLMPNAAAAAIAQLCDAIN